MCAPAIGLALTLAQGVMGFVQQSQQADAQEAALNAQAEVERQRLEITDRALQDRADEVNAAAATDQATVARQAAVERARVLVAQGEQGGGGLTTARLLRDVGFHAGLQLQDIEANRATDQRQISRDRQGVALGAQSAELNRDIRRAQIQRPSILGTGLQIAGSAFGQVASANRAGRGLFEFRNPLI